MKLKVNTIKSKLQISLLISISFILCLIMILSGIFIYSKSRADKGSNVSAAYQFSSNNVISMTDYNKNTNFEITNVEGYLGFVQSCNYQFMYSASDSRNFYTKTVTLKSDIVLTSDHYSVLGVHTGSYYFSTVIFLFAGTFDGENHSIEYQFSLNNDLCNSDDSAFCSYNDGTIKNLWLKSPTIYCNYSEYVGAICGRNDGTITNCVVSTPTIYSNSSKCKFAPIAGDNIGQVTNCFVFGNYGLSLSSARNASVSAYYFVVSTNEASNCVFDASVFETSDSDKSKQPSECDTNAESLGNWLSDDSAYTAQLPSAWYKYSSGCNYTYTIRLTGLPPVQFKTKVFLKSFISFTTYTFKAEEGGQVDKTLVEVPTDYNYVTQNGNKLTVYGITITATAEEDYLFEGWEKAGDVYTAKFKISVADVVFVDGGNHVTSSGIKTYKVKVENTITVTETKYESGRLKAVKFEFYNTSNQKCTVTYTAHSEYYINGYNLSNTKITDNMSISLTGVTLKLYDGQYH